MTELEQQIWIEKYRPKKFEDLILEDKPTLVKYLDTPSLIPSFIFHSVKPGTGKTSAAKIIIKELDCESLCINSSDERGIDTIRDKIKLFSRSLSFREGIKRCIFMDEADGLTRQAQDSLRNLMEEYSDNCFFIFTANDVNKIIEPIRSRCKKISFERPNKACILNRLIEITEAEKLNVSWDEGLQKLIDLHYPDVRQMIMILQNATLDGKQVEDYETEFESFLKLIQEKNIKEVYSKVFSGDFNMMGFNKWFFEWLFQNENDFNKCRVIATKLADNEKAWNLGSNLEIVFMSNLLEIMKVL